MIPTGHMVDKGKCSDCGDWWYTKERGPNGRWIELGVNNYGKMQWKQHVHDCPGPIRPGQSLNTLHEKVNQMSTDASEFVKDRANTDMKNMFSLAADMALTRQTVDRIEQLCETIVKKQGLFESANSMIPQHVDIGSGRPPQRPQLKPFTHDKNESDDIVEELSNTDDTTSSDENTSINFMDQRSVDTD